MYKEPDGGLASCQHTPDQNRLLASLASAGDDRLLRRLKIVRIRKNEDILEHARRQDLAYFPVNCVISVYHTLKNGTSTEVAMIGNEGMFDVTRVMGGEGMPYSAIAQTTGHAFQLDMSLLRKEFEGDGAIRHTLLLYAQVLLTQMAQTVVCNRHHSLIQQLCLILLLVNDKSLSNDLLLTQENIAHMMGVRRESITEVAGKLRDGGLIDYRRGHIMVMDRPALEAQCCECYAVVRNEFKRLLDY